MPRANVTIVFPAPSRDASRRFLARRYNVLYEEFINDPYGMRAGNLVTLALLARHYARLLPDAKDAQEKFNFLTTAVSVEGYVGTKLTDLFEEQLETLDRSDALAGFHRVAFPNATVVEEMVKLSKAAEAKAVKAKKKASR